MADHLCLISTYQLQIIPGSVCSSNGIACFRSDSHVVIKVGQSDIFLIWVSLGNSSRLNPGLSACAIPLVEIPPFYLIAEDLSDDTDDGGGLPCAGQW
jgi:hypothetical protein